MKIRDKLACNHTQNCLGWTDECWAICILALGIKVDFSLSAERVIGALDQIIEWRGKPLAIRSDNGPEYISELLRKWSEKHDIRLDFIPPGNPQQNAYV